MGAFCTMHLRPPLVCRGPHKWAAMRPVHRKPQRKTASQPHLVPGLLGGGLGGSPVLASGTLHVHKQWEADSGKQASGARVQGWTRNANRCSTICDAAGAAQLNSRRTSLRLICSVSFPWDPPGMPPSLKHPPAIPHEQPPALMNTLLPSPLNTLQAHTHLGLVPGPASRVAGARVAVPHPRHEVRIALLGAACKKWPFGNHFQKLSGSQCQCCT